MGVSYLSISAVCTLLSFVGLQYWTDLSFQKLTSDGVIGEDSIEPGNARQALKLLLGSQATIALLANFVLNVFVLIILGLKTIFFVELYPSETRKLVERLMNYVIYKGTFLPLVVPPTIFQVGLWSTWLIILCSLKMFQALARDRLERLNASPSATPWTYFRVYSVLLLVISSDLLWIKLCLGIYSTLESAMFLLLFFEPLSIAFETLQAVVVHGFQLLDIWLHHSAGNRTNCQKLFDISAAGSLWEWKCIIIRNLGFFLDMMTLLMALGHYVHIWWLHGMSFHLVDVVLFLNIRALLSAIVKRINGFIRLKIALGALHGALPDATSEEIRAYDDECAICREPMAKAKRLSCNHLFHLACLRSWLDQGLNENYSCPTCRKPLHVGRPEGATSPRVVDVSTDEQLAHQISSGLDRHNPPSHTLPTGVFPNQMQNPLESGTWRGAGLDSSWLHTWSDQGLDGAGPSTGTGSVGLGRVQMMMRHLAAVGETYAQTALEDTTWSLWPMNPSQAGTSTSPIPPPGSARYPGGAGGLHLRTASQSANDDIANILSMAETVQEVLPHIPDELIFQDLQRTNSVTVTVNNLLQM
ncbi:E3 ubiquitin protein ligase RIN2-like isoform X1 [Camellia sinensis]|uniref:E3 ubiquitin protein ligase RIN2-like isoform X1 n=2 Tax=Camellia sinensis TaxID=4442 RepID=UPI0010364DDC|nr:E3 ubiquitin protein ligase RIN2-like isoform X1 [Camellia sinensis]XP_028123012.1 E3 ubiquitin protein ligase RIN2-like isoform X1 [Camellia sinensis]XP_028123013.1 E3 ubiquitin protein ligase RIN2-like isoform X1 [Camellia sinensis]XP_028123014.1 E3 ubiquitin protein ligase RIN2-like isoform X1 [Camellia sinensis]